MKHVNYRLKRFLLHVALDVGVVLERNKIIKYIKSTVKCFLLHVAPNDVRNLALECGFDGFDGFCCTSPFMEVSCRPQQNEKVYKPTGQMYFVARRTQMS